MSTTGRSIMLLIHPNAGKVHLDGHDVMKLDSLPEQMRRSIQIIFQHSFARKATVITLRRWWRCRT